MSHQREIDEGRAIPPHQVTGYRCVHGHLFLIAGPHVFCRCKKPCHLYQVRERRAYGTWFTDAWCGCGARTKKRATINRVLLRSASAAWLVGGYASAAIMLGADPGFKPAGQRVYEVDTFVPDDFPTWDGRPCLS